MTIHRFGSPDAVLGSVECPSCEESLSLLQLEDFSSRRAMAKYLAFLEAPTTLLGVGTDAGEA